MSNGQPLCRPGAEADAELFARNYGSKRAARTWLLELALAQDLLEREDFTAAKKELERWVPALDRAGPIDTRLIAHASCERWLSRHYRLEFPRITELAPAGGRSASPMPPGAPLPDPRKP